METTEKYKKTAEYYNRYGSWYDAERVVGYYEAINQQEIDIVKKYGSGKKVLEIGCGTGIILDQVKLFASEAFGVDISDGMLQKAREKGLNVQVANAAAGLPYPSESFDVVYSFKVLAHIHEIEKAVAEAVRVVKKDGVMILEFYNAQSLKHLANMVYNFLKKRDVYIRFDTFAKMKSYLPPGWHISETYGIKLVPLGKRLSSNRFIVKLERIMCRTFLKRFGGYFVIVARKYSEN